MVRKRCQEPKLFVIEKKKVSKKSAGRRFADAVGIRVKRLELSRSPLPEKIPVYG